MSWPKLLIIPALLIACAAAAEPQPIIQNPNFDFRPADNPESGPRYVNINKDNCPFWKPSDSVGNSHWTPIATRFVKGTFNLPDVATHMQAQTMDGLSDVYQQVTIPTSGW